MRVVLLSYNAPLHNAIGNCVVEKVQFFEERGAEVRLCVEDARQLHPRLRSLCVEVRHADVPGPLWDMLVQADLIVAVYAGYYDLLQVLPRLAGGPARIVLEYHGVTPPQLWPDQHREGLQTSLKQRGYVWCADHALSMSQFSRRELCDATHFPDIHHTTLPLPVNIEHFRSQPRERFLQERLRISGRILLFVGRLAGNKRAPMLIEALHRLHDSELHAVIVGDCQDVYAGEMQRCCDQARRLGVAERVHFPGQLTDGELPLAYRSADVLVIPSLHEGFCVPVIEAMACGVPVLASRCTALPETVGDAGLTFIPDDAEDMARQLRRILGTGPSAYTASPENTSPRRIAVVCFRFGQDVVGGAETSLRTLAHAMQDAGHHVEIFTTCTKSESHWKNEVPAGTGMLDGLPVHRFAINPHDAGAHGTIYRAILEADGQVAPETEFTYLVQSIHSSSLIDALRARQAEFDAIVTGPYLFGLTADIITACPDKTLVVPCFHDEPLARLSVWPRLFGEAAGILYHSPEEQCFAQARLGVNHPNAWQLGAVVPLSEGAASLPESARPYLVYCGRYSEQKNVPLLLDWARRYQSEQASWFDLVFMGCGEVALPCEPWLRDLGRVDEGTKRAVLAGAWALVQLSTHESLSLVVLEAWAAETPVIVHGDCPVLVGQIERAQGGVAVADYAAFAAALDDLQHNETRWQQRGTNGRAYVAGRYASKQEYAERVCQAIDQMRRPLREQMRARGLQRAQHFARERWQERFGEFIEKILTRPARPYREEIHIEPLRAACQGVAGTRTLLIPVRLKNAGTHAAVPKGPGRTVVCYEIRAADAERVVIPRRELDLPALLLPGQSHVAALPVTLPDAIGSYRLHLWTQREASPKQPSVPECVIALTLAAPAEAESASCASAFLEAVQETLPKTQDLQQLPEDYVDVTEGRFASAKRFLKRKLLNNFKQGYVDVLSRQQSQVNTQLVEMVHQLAECCAMLDHAVSGVHQRLDALEAKVDRLVEPRPELEAVPVGDSNVIQSQAG